MGIQSDEKYRGLLAELGRVNDLIDREQYAEAKDACLKLRATCTAQGIRSAHVAWTLAIACDYTGDFELAFESIREAVAMDPMAAPAWNSFRIIVEHMRAAVSEPERAADQSALPRLYHLLVQSNEATTPCHVSFAGHLLAKDRAREALRLLEAVITLNPAHTDAWRQLALVRRGLGDEEGARRAEAEAAVTGDGAPIPFSVAGRARA